MEPHETVLSIPGITRLDRAPAVRRHNHTSSIKRYRPERGLICRLLRKVQQCIDLKTSKPSHQMKDRLPSDAPKTATLASPSSKPRYILVAHFGRRNFRS